MPWRRGGKLPFVRGSPNRLVHGQAKASSTRTASEASFRPRQKPAGVGTDSGQTGFLLWALLVRGSVASLGGQCHSMRRSAGLVEQVSAELDSREKVVLALETRARPRRMGRA